ncbi:MAG TPA: flagellar biosynthesis protein FlhB [Defluviitoga sp.]|nr:flagellar biosynthesis protein FlhB [Defluviitoga sp.]
MDKKIDGPLVKIDLQLFADPEKTEQPTPRRLEKAREEGNIPISNEFNMAMSLLAMSMLLMFLFNPLVAEIERLFYDYFALEVDFEGTELLAYEVKTHSSLYLKLVIFFGVSVIVSSILGMIQTKFLFTTKSLKFDLSRINPINGFKRLFSMRTVVELLKAILKLCVVGFLTYNIFKSNWNLILSLADQEIGASFQIIFDMITKILFQLGIALLILSLFDFWYQRHAYMQDLKMSKYEIKQEMKEIEGNPEVKQRQREIMRRMLMTRMMQKVPEADVVVTNPTHYAVALQYDAETMDAPIVVAKGVNEIAFKIRDIAFKNGVPIVQRPSLAKKLYEEVDLNEEIPEDLYTVVAEVLAYVYRISR